MARHQERFVDVHPLMGVIGLGIRVQTVMRQPGSDLPDGRLSRLDVYRKAHPHAMSKLVQGGDDGPNFRIIDQ